MTPEEEQWIDVISNYHLGQLGDQEFSALENTLRVSPELREIFRQACRLDTLLRREAEQLEESSNKILFFKKPVTIGAAAAILVALAVAAFLFFGGSDSAVIAGTVDAVWKKGNWTTGSRIKSKRTLQLASGEVEVRFNSGAVTRLTGPATFKIINANAGSLSLGSADSVADTPESHGFAIEVPKALVVDLGTAFVAKVDTDGGSLVAVDDGSVEVAIGKLRKQLNEGESLYIPSSGVPHLLIIEQGEGTPAFSFPGIDPPSNDDYIGQNRDKARIYQRSRSGEIGEVTAFIENMFDGKGQSSQLAPDESFFFEDGKDGFFVIDLGKSLSLKKLNSYTWYQGPDQRSAQLFDLWGIDAEELPKVTEADENLPKQGWTFIATVDSNRRFETNHPPQQACSIEPIGESLGKYRYLIINMKPNLGVHSFHGEIDIYTNDNQ